MSNRPTFPQRTRNHAVGASALQALEQSIAGAGYFISQGADIEDYGVDLTLEALSPSDDDSVSFVTNARVVAQIKGTEKDSNSDGSVSVSVDRSNLRYLTMQPYAIYICYHLPTKRLLWMTAEEAFFGVGRHNSAQSSETFTIRFEKVFSGEAQQNLAGIAIDAASRDQARRLSSEPQIHVHVPDDPKRAYALLRSLSDTGRDQEIHSAAESFLSILGSRSLESLPVYLAEVNLGINAYPFNKSRVETVAELLQDTLFTNALSPRSTLYCLANARTVLGQSQKALTLYAAVLDLHAASGEKDTDIAAMAHKNWGALLEKKGQHDEAVEHYLEALELRPELGEARMALASAYFDNQDFELALTTLARTRFEISSAGTQASLDVLRVKCLFALDRDVEAFDIIVRLTNDRELTPRSWYHLARIVRIYGRSKPENYEEAVRFWTDYVKQVGQEDAVLSELHFAEIVYRQRNPSIGRSWSELFEILLSRNVSMDADTYGLLWDRLGHWAQDEERWEDAVKCFEKASETNEAEYGYCLGIAYHEVGRASEACEILQRQAQTHMPDSMSWHQLGRAHMTLNQYDLAIDALTVAVGMDPSNRTALFDLGGALWNDAQPINALEIWEIAKGRFPDAPEIHQVERLFSDDDTHE